MTTLIPGFVYADATVMKVCLVFGLVSAVIALAEMMTGDRTERGADAKPSTFAHTFWAITSIALTASTPWVGALVVVIARALADEPTSLSVTGFSDISRTAVLVTLAVISVAATSAVASLTRREHPRTLPLLALAANLLLIALFIHFAFYARGFDQDTWAPR